ncbi:MAG: hypothetical protein LBT39_01405, partial [Treponema sp.]|nr:hypothetical protein [Treponema sp.]
MQLYVGDLGHVEVNLGAEFQGVLPFVIEDPRLLPQETDVKIRRVKFDRLRGGRDRLLIDFTAFAPGQLELPQIDLPQLPGFTLEGCRVNIVSMLGGADSLLILSNPASPLAVPGTALIIYGTSTLIVLILLFIMGMGLWGRPYLEGLLEAHRRRRLIRLMRNIGKRLWGKIPSGNVAGSSARCQEILRDLSAEFRSFLGYFFNCDCRAMTAAEFLLLPPLFSFSDNADSAVGLVAPLSLRDYFHRM